MKKIIVTVIFIAHAGFALTQDLHFSQFYETPLWRNPALAGIFTGQFRVQTVFRNQWQGIDGVNKTARPYQTIGFGGEIKFLGDCLGDKSFVGGIQVLRDRAGDSKLTRTISLLSLTLRQNISDNLQGAAGFYGGHIWNNFSPTDLQWDDQYVNGQFSPLNLTAQPFPYVHKRNYWDVGAGISLSNRDTEYYQWYLGVAAFHVNRAQMAFTPVDTLNTKQNMRFTANGAMGFLVNEFDNIRFYGDVMTQGKQNQFLFGVVYKKRVNPENDVQDDGLNISVGCLYRYADAVIPVANINFEKWTIGLSYDINVSKLSLAPKMQGGMEMTLKLRGILQPGFGICEHKGCL